MRKARLLISLAIIVVVSPGAAQSSTSGAIQGVIKDENGAALAGVTVVATAATLQGSRSTITDGDGSYKLTNLPVGTYTVVFYYADSQVKRSNVRVSLKKTTPVYVKMIGSNAGETITIESSPPLVDADIPPPGRSFEAALGTIAGSGDDGTGVSFSGSTSLENTYTVDGVSTTGLTYGTIGAGGIPTGNTEHYEYHGLNPMTNPGTDRFSTFAIDVDTASYSIARTKILAGGRPHPDSVRVEEFVNYFRYGYAGPTVSGRPFVVHMDAAPSPFTGGRTLMRVGVQARKVAVGERKPANLVFLVDVSGSMSSENKLPLAKDALRVLVDNLTELDTVALVTYAGNTAVRLEPTNASNKETILTAIEELSSAGSTAMGAGIDLAYELAARELGEGTVSRVIVLSDGDANVGNTSHESILETISERVEAGVTLTTVGFGVGNYQDHKMEQLANKGNGNNFYIDSINEAEKVFGEQLAGTLEVVAKDVKIQVEFNPDAVESYRLVGYENRDIADEDFRDDKVDAGEIGLGHTVTAIYELDLKEDSRERIATVRIRSMVPRGKKAVETTYVFDRRNLHRRFDDAHADFRFAAAVTGAAEILRHSRHADEWSLADVVRIARAASTEDQADRQEFIRLMESAAGFDRYVLPRRTDYYRTPEARRGHVVAGASFGGLIIRGDRDSNVAPITAVRLGYGRGATDLTLQLASSRQVANSTVSLSTTPVGDPLSVYSIGTMLSHRFLLGSKFHPVGGLGLESLIVSPRIGESRMAIAATGRIGLEVVHSTSIAAFALGFDATGHLPVAQNDQMPMNMDSLITLGTYLDARF